MEKRLVRTGNSLAVVLGRKLLAKVGIDQHTPLVVVAEAGAVIVARAPARRRVALLGQVFERASRQYDSVFKRLTK